MRHSSIVVLDTLLRCHWFSFGLTPNSVPCQFPLSAGLLASAQMKRKCERHVVRKGTVHESYAPVQ